MKLIGGHGTPFEGDPSFLPASVPNRNRDRVAAPLQRSDQLFRTLRANGWTPKRRRPITLLLPASPAFAAFDPTGPERVEPGPERS